MAARNSFAGTEGKYGRLRPIEIDHVRVIKSGQRLYFWRCACDCGGETVAAQAGMLTGDTKSCGCLRREMVAAKNAKHGLSQSPEYEVWSGMKRRCSNVSRKEFHNYGGRGISVCDRWLNSFENFLADVGPKPFQTATIERIDNDGNYEPGNCKWATRREQMNNIRKNVILVIDGESATMAEWCRKFGIVHNSVLRRLANGWDTKRAVMTPPRRWPSQIKK